jgi:tRNA G18 (ribose-2'-O)-methylase SpoU
VLIDCITDPDDPRVTDFPGLPDAVLLRERKVFVAEGRLVVKRLLRATRFRPRSLLVTKAALTALEDDLAIYPGVISVYLATPDLIERICGFKFHRGCLAIGERPAPLAIGKLLGGVSFHNPLIVAERINDADNVGSIFRNASAFGAAAVVLSRGCCDPLYRKALRASMGACLQVPFTMLDDCPDDLQILRQFDYHLVALTPDRKASPLERFYHSDRNSWGGTASRIRGRRAE